MAKKWTRIGAVIKRKPNKDGSSNGVYIKLSEGVAGLKMLPGDIVNVQDPRVSLDEAVKAGRMDQEKVDYLKSKIPDFVVFELTHVSKE